MLWQDVVIGLVLLFEVIYILSRYNVIGAALSANREKEIQRRERNRAWKQKVTYWLLQHYTNFATMTGGVTQARVEELTFFLKRERVMVPALNRLYTPIELVGKYKLLGYLIFSVGICVYWLTKNPIFLVSIAGLFLVQLKIMFWQESVRKRDIELEKGFPDLYLYLFSRLNRKGAAKMAGTLEEFIKELEFTHGSDKLPEVGLFAKDFRTLIEIYSEERVALKYLREVYKSATIINFINLANQSISGVDNKDKLLSFKTELSLRKLQSIEEEGERRIRKVMKAIWLVLIILGEFVLLSMLAKMGTSLSGLGSLLGF